MFAKVSSVAVVGLDARPVDVEIDIGGGLPDFRVVGLPSAAVKEAPRRVRAAVVNSGRQWPMRKVTASLAPGDLRKDGVLFDLPLAVGVLAAFGQLNSPALNRYGLVGELALDGSLRPIRGALAAALAARDQGWDGIVLPRQNLPEAGLVTGIQVIGAADLSEALAFLGEGRVPGDQPGRVCAAEMLRCSNYVGPDMSDVRGQAQALRALEIAAAGSHNVLMVGPPGCGKTMMAQRMPGIMPPLTEEEAIEATRVWSVAGMLPIDQALIIGRPFRAPHHHASAAALIGGGSPLPRPGEISLAHRGVLFLDELPLFSRLVLEALRQPLEEGSVRVVRQATRVEFPAAFCLVGAANPCLCPGPSGSAGCACPPGRLDAYRSRLSGPLLDRIDLQVEVPRLTPDELFDLEPAESSAVIRDRVIAARAFRRRRLEIEKDPAGVSDLAPALRRFLRHATSSAEDSARGMDRLVKVARSIADLALTDEIDEQHLAEALQYRRPVWGAL